MAALGAEIRRAAARDPEPVLITGEPGTGKGQVARLIHRLGRRSGGPLEEVPCGGLDPDGAARALFGWAEGAAATSAGVLELAQGGSVVLDPLECLTSEVQHRLVGFLETGTLHRLGSTAELDLPLDVRVIAATHRGPPDAERESAIASDLRRILGRVSIHLPPLRERAEEDRVVLVHGVARDLRRAMGRGPVDIAPAALTRLVEYSWPGNLREMRNAIERAVMAAGEEDTLRTAHLPSDLRSNSPATGAATGAKNGNRRGFQPESLAEVERRHIEAVLRHHGGNRTRAARDLGIARATLINKIKGYGLDL
jgi:DNA-binding NtrC family response regulator